MAIERHADLRAEAGTETEGVFDGIRTAAGQAEAAEIWVRLLEIGHRRNDPRLQRLDREHVFDAHSHRVARVSLRIGDHDPVRGRSEHVPQRVDLGLRAPTARRGVGLVRYEHGLGRDLAPVDAPASLRQRDEVLHHVADVRRVQTAAVVGGVGRHGRQHL